MARHYIPIWPAPLVTTHGDKSISIMMRQTPPYHHMSHNCGSSCQYSNATNAIIHHTATSQQMTNILALLGNIPHRAVIADVRTSSILCLPVKICHQFRLTAASLVAAVCQWVSPALQVCLHHPPRRPCCRSNSSKKMSYAVKSTYSIAN